MSDKKNALISLKAGSNRSDMKLIEKIVLLVKKSLRAHIYKVEDDIDKLRLGADRHFVAASVN